MENVEGLLKADVKQWWEEHPMDYMDWAWDGSIKDRENAKQFFQNIDSSFRNAAFFAQKLNSDFLFSNLIPYERLVGKRVLEVGCGLGAHASEIARAGAQVTAIDLTEKAVFVTRKRFKLYGLSGDIRVADAESLPFDNERFDFVWSWGVLHHTPNTSLTIKEIYRVLKQGGEARVMIYHRHSLMNLRIIIRSGLISLLKSTLIHPSKAEQYMQSLRNKHTNGKRIGGSPLAKYYSRREAKLLFKQFRKINISAYSQKSELINFFKRPHLLMKLIKHLPDSVFNAIFEKVGFFLFIQAVK